MRGVLPWRMNITPGPGICLSLTHFQKTGPLILTFTVHSHLRNQAIGKQTSKTKQKHSRLHLHSVFFSPERECQRQTCVLPFGVRRGQRRGLWEQRGKWGWNPSFRHTPPEDSLSGRAAIFLVSDSICQVLSLPLSPRPQHKTSQSAPHNPPNTHTPHLAPTPSVVADGSYVAQDHRDTALPSLNPCLPPSHP